MNKDQLLSDALNQIEKEFGTGTVMRLGDASSMEIETISTGSIALDIALGVGGLPKAVYAKYTVRSHLEKQR